MVAVLYGIAFSVLLLYGLHLLWLCYRYAGTAEVRGIQDERFVVRDTGFLPAVTVQLPVYNEAYVVERLIDACARLDYPHRLLEIQVLDDSTDVTSDLIAARVAHWERRGRDIVHIRRQSRAGFKAGALQNGLRLASGSFVAVLDADFVPPPDFLRRMIPHLGDPTVGMVQARWVHPDAESSLITRIQAFGLDAHFALEQWIRHRLGFFINFNGTGGIWRRQAILDAGGWQADTLTEDLDLSYRAQMAGWRLKYAHDVEIPAELPADMASLRAQQARWTRGSVETARKLLTRLWRSDQSLPVKVEGTFHLSGHFIFPFLLLISLLHAPLVLMTQAGGGASGAFFAVMAIGVFGFGGFLLAQALAQRDLYHDWLRRLSTFPLFLAASLGISLSNTIAVVQGLARTRSTFARTPKLPRQALVEDPLRYRIRRFPLQGWIEAALALYTVAGLGALIEAGAWASIPFQAFFACGFLLVALASLDVTGLRSQRRAGSLASS